MSSHLEVAGERPFDAQLKIDARTYVTWITTVTAAAMAATTHGVG
jgi:hypothetical protein